MSDMQRQAREKHVQEDPRQLDLVLPVSRADPDDACLVPAAWDLSWQTATPAEQWNLITENDR